MKLPDNSVEAANRHELTAILIFAFCHVLTLHADINGVDIVIHTPEGEVRNTQIKARPTIEWERYGGRSIWMAFPDPQGEKIVGKRLWFHVKHDLLVDFFNQDGGKRGLDKEYSRSEISKKLLEFLQPYILKGSGQNAQEEQTKP